ncbi:MAG: single-stranded-DNA-specific exonuclease RecJ [Flavobacteriales bacterium]|nr:single-stranded-DNA-specific exonuclease RecJ [Flavobacteriales bacterium]
MEKRWVEKGIESQTAVENLASSLSVSNRLSALLVNRGINTFEEAKTFFRPQLDMLHDPFLMADMNVAIQRIEKALSATERIMVYGDYDVDGTTAVSLVYSFFSQITDKIDYYIPDRYAEGYGVSKQGIDFAIENGITLIICLDCGIKANDLIHYAKENNVDFIVCDHHLPGKELPPAVAILDPKRKECSYPYDELSGCGIGFKLVQAYAMKNNIDFKELHQYLDLTAISIAADIVPLTGENRVLAFFGLVEINARPRMGIRALLELAKAKKSLTLDNLVFIIGPRINAAGRIKTGRNAVRLLISNDEDEAKKTSALIDEHNLERRALDKEITAQALEMIEKSTQLQGQKSTVLYDPNWHKGVIGIVASRLIENYYRPTIVLTNSNGKAAGSARSVVGFSVYEAIEECSDLLMQFGGHKYAAGLTIKTENIEAFQKKFEEVVSSTIDSELLIPTLEIDAELHFADITGKFYRVLKQFAPFGPMNMTPVFKTTGVLDTGYAKTVGADQTHLKICVFDPEDMDKSFSAIGFGLGDKLDIIQSGEPFNICYTIEENEWNDKVTLQLNIKDIKAN